MTAGNDFYIIIHFPKVQDGFGAWFSQRRAMNTHPFFAEQHLTTKAEEHEPEPGTKKRLPGVEGPPEGEHVPEQAAVICSVPWGPWKEGKLGCL